LLDTLGETALLTHAYRQSATLDAALRDDVRQLIGWTVSTDELEARGEALSDRWITLGQWVNDDDRVRVQRTWLLGQRSKRIALVLQFSVASQSFDEIFPPGACFDAELRFWPSAYPVRARVTSRASAASEVVSLRERPPGHDSIEAFLATWAEAIGRQPWLDRLGCALLAVTPIATPDGAWLIADRAGVALPLAGDEHWRLLAISGGAPVDMLGEWSGESLLPLGVFAAGAYAPLWGVNE
jgi:hypothetical protein